MTTKMIKVLHNQMSNCIRAAERQGYRGADRDYVFTAEDCASIACALEDAGLKVSIKDCRNLASIHDACQAHDEQETSFTAPSAS